MAYDVRTSPNHCAIDRSYLMRPASTSLAPHLRIIVPGVRIVEVIGRDRRPVTVGNVLEAFHIQLCAPLSADEFRFLDPRVQQAASQVAASRRAQNPAHGQAGPSGIDCMTAMRLSPVFRGLSGPAPDQSWYAHFE